MTDSEEKTDYARFIIPGLLLLLIIIGLYMNWDVLFPPHLQSGYDLSDAFDIAK